MVAIPTIGFARRCYWASAVSACCENSGTPNLTRYHMNEGHAALLALELLGEEAERDGRTTIRGEDIIKVRSKCVFTTHTPVPAGHDRFPMEFLTRVFPDQNSFFDLKDASSADLVKNVLQAEQTIPICKEQRALARR